MLPDSSDIVGVAEIAEIAKVTVSAVSNWQKRKKDFPTPLARLKMSPIYSKKQIIEWLKAHKKVSCIP